MSLIKAGARMAEPGEFTRRAFTNGRLDLAEAEAVADIIAASSKAAHSLAMAQLQGRFSKNIDSLRERLINLASLLELELDFSEEDVTFADRDQLRQLATEVKATVDGLASTFASGQALRDGIPVTIIGEPNVGKSRLLNALLGSDRAIVSDIPGTTRDTVEDTIDIAGQTFRFIDTAGIRDTDDPVERLGIERALDKAARARIVIWLLTPDQLNDRVKIDEFLARLQAAMAPDATLITVINKIDTVSEQLNTDAITKLKPIKISALIGTGIDLLTDTISHCVTDALPSDEGMIVTNARHHAALVEGSEALGQLLDGIGGPYPLTPDLLAQHLRQSITSLGAITGTITSQQILNNIFHNFCIGK